MKVLILEEDLFTRVGGGQTVYRRLCCDHRELSFVYLRRDEAETADRPPHVRTAPLAAERSFSITRPLFFPDADRQAVARARTCAQAVAGLSFDVIDVPDYTLFGPHLAEALKAHDVAFGAIVHAMHGVVSDSLARDWATRPHSWCDVRRLETAQFAAADHRYAISQRYAAEWRARHEASIDVHDPLTVLKASAFEEPHPSNDHGRRTVDAKPELLVVGRRERRKGNDLALEIAAWLDPDLHAGLIHIGPPSPAEPQRDSDDHLCAMAERRGVPWRVEPSTPRATLFQRYRTRPCIVLAPVRYDTLNLVVLEAMAAGAPTAVSVHAGVCDYLDGLPFASPHLAIDPDRPEETAQALTRWLEDYPAAADAARAFAPVLRDRIRPMDLRTTYAKALEAARAGRAERQAQAISIAGVGAPSVDAPHAERAAQATVRAQARALMDKAYQAQERHPWLRSFRRPYRALRAAGRAVAAARTSMRDGHGVMSVLALADAMNAMPERSDAEIAAKIDRARTFDHRYGGRVSLWAELARLERLRGEPLRAAAYDLRVMRLSGRDPFARTPLVLQALRAAQMDDVAAATAAQWGPAAQDNALKTLFETREARLRDPEPAPNTAIASVNEARTAQTPIVSVIVSLYNAAEKLPRFLALLREQTLAKAARMEVIFIDAASPMNERAAVEEHIKTLGPHCVFARCHERITIQAAWNIGLALTRAPYVACLGVDETVYPQALETLAEMLSRDPTVDWAMGSSVVTDVTETAAFEADKMFYDRRDAARDMTTLDTTYVSWVGGLYRRDVHDRFGYYDPSFRAAGDTEFKMRVLSRLKVAFAPQTLGRFLDYPDARATAGVRAELEDALAWYAHRTPDGVARWGAHLSTAELQRLTAWCAGRRKCFSEQPSTDVELGAAAAAQWALRPDAPASAVRVAGLFETMRDELRAYDFTPGRATPPPSIEVLKRGWRTHSEVFRTLMGADGESVPAFDVWNDNRFEQHSWIWDEEA